jgi:hypothetical protein
MGHGAGDSQGSEDGTPDPTGLRTRKRAKRSPPTDQCRRPLPRLAHRVVLCGFDVGLDDPTRRLLFLSEPLAKVRAQPVLRVRNWRYAALELKVAQERLRGGVAILGIGCERHAAHVHYPLRDTSRGGNGGNLTLQEPAHHVTIGEPEP